MINTESDYEESSGRAIVEVINQLKSTALGEGAAVCEVCGEELWEGDPLVVFAFRPVDHPMFEIGHVKCTECRHEPTEYFTLGVREVVLDGRVGTCSDQVSQSSWPVLLAPRLRAVSSADTTAVQPLPGVAWFRRLVERSDVFAAADCASGRKPWQRSVVRADDSPGDGASGDDASASVVRRSAVDDGLGGGR